jgi:serine/threonine protein kinase
MSQSRESREFVEEIADEFMQRFRRGERPSVEEYVRRYPKQADEIRALFPALILMEEMAPDDDSGNSPGHKATRAVVTPLQRLGDYRIVREVGRGGMGVVYEVVQESLGRRVALKVLPAQSAADPRVPERFKRESRAAARLHHTNIVPVFEVGEEGGVCYFALQFIQGQPLDEVLQELRRLRSGAAGAAAGAVAQSLWTGSFALPAPAAPDEPPASSADRTERLSTTTAVLSGQSELSGVESNYRLYCQNVARLGLQVAEALAHAHERGIVHRDIKPSNLLLDTAGVVWVSDFGLAQTEERGLTEAGEVVGTLRYIPPERFRGASDARGDVYSLGLTLYELLTLRPAFDHSDRVRLIEQIGRQEPERPRVLDGRIPRDLETVVLKAMAKEPGRRYPTAAALAEDLRRFLADRPILARRSSAWERTRRWCRRNPLPASLVAAVLLVLLAGIAASSFFAIRANERATQALANEEAANTQRGIAEANEKAAKANELLARRRFYAAQVNLAHQAYEAGDLARALAILETQRPRFDEEDLRTFEWYCLWQLCHQRLRFSWQLKSGNTYAVACSPRRQPAGLRRLRWQGEAF